MSPIKFVEVDAQKINNDLINDFQDALGETFYPGDERRIFLQQETQVIVGLKNDINDSAKQNLLRYARGAKLDALGERTDTPRLPAQKANTTLRFTLSEVQPSNITVPTGTRATPDGEIYFATNGVLVIIAGQAFGDVLAQSTEAGGRYDGFAPGQINQLVDPVPFVASVANIDISSGGSNIEPDDDGVNIWSGYRGRIRDSVNKFSTAGPDDAYIYWAKTADVNIQDVTVTSPNPGEVKITVLMKGGDLPSQDVLDKVLEICSGKKVRPLTDLVTAAAPDQVSYDITLTYYIADNNSAQENAIREAIEDDGGAVEQYQEWQNSKMGRDINPDYLRHIMLKAGAYLIDLTVPVYAAIEDDEVPVTGQVTITYGGLL